jgi:exopolysaccharide production protein ExoQ
MNSSVATIVYAVAIMALFVLDRDRRMRVSMALWIPVAWVSIGSSRMVSQWFGMSVTESPDQYLDGSPLDRLILTGLLAAGLIVLLSRGTRIGTFLRANGPILLFFLYGAASVLWSDYPDVAFKRWTKAFGDLVMVMVVLTDPEPVAAVKQLLKRVGFLLIPLSILLIKYYPELGRLYNRWTWVPYYSGVALEKNSLGFICLIFGLASLWLFLDMVHHGEPRHRTRPLIAHGTILAMTAWLFAKADSATSLACFFVGGVLIVLSGWRSLALGPTAVNILAGGMVSVCLLGVFVTPDVGLVQAMGRNETLTGRTELWDELVRMPGDPLFGTGFESFWLGERAKTLWKRHWWHPNEAHNGYLETYLNLGLTGVVLLGFLIIWGYRNAVDAVPWDAELGPIRLAFVVVAVLYNLTEAAFKEMHPVWITFLLAAAVAPTLRQNE